MFDSNVIEKFDEFVEQLSTESHRAAVIIGAAKIDQVLYLILSKYLLPSRNNDDELLEGDSPLSTFSARINLIFRLGIIDNEFSNALHLIRKIRNDFAHNIDTRLDQAPNRDRARDFVKNVKESDFFKDVKQVYFPASDDFFSEFRIALTVFAIRLECLANSISLLEKVEPQSLIPQIYSEVSIPI